jgi:hypothetical protein
LEETVMKRMALWAVAAVAVVVLWGASDCLGG